MPSALLVVRRQLRAGGSIWLGPPVPSRARQETWGNVSLCVKGDGDPPGLPRDPGRPCPLSTGSLSLGPPRRREPLLARVLPAPRGARGFTEPGPVEMQGVSRPPGGSQRTPHPHCSQALGPGGKPGAPRWKHLAGSSHPASSPGGQSSCSHSRRGAALTATPRRGSSADRRAVRVCVRGPCPAQSPGPAG